jgi:hypothetical protein
MKQAAPATGAKLFEHLSRMSTTSASWTLYAKWPKEFVEPRVQIAGAPRP